MIPSVARARLGVASVFVGEENEPDGIGEFWVPLPRDWRAVDMVHLHRVTMGSLYAGESFPFDTYEVS
jgi:hypothetical protein